ncbi:Rieske 2Fe-2S domain-containing protein [Xylophilus rhododendri]|uniref:Rieske 2Fe-2S domain-containing protein n=1 Tax=Xylophilus rhododendri TaxID=2697032 RepID=A0A857J4U3_9BURK|nr:Rieske 2Fe-2S domain-containing protein [Xylophilus rhododendri]QHI98052.1 Rieske 2Fe-2S domain-containing protein [Xylophilus rhododendri]
MFEDDEPAAPGIPLCNSAHLVEGGMAVPFDVRYGGQTCTAFAVRYRGEPVAYLNRCTHVAMELDARPGRVFDDSGRWLLCQVHGAAYEPATGACAGGPCRGGLVKIQLSERAGVVRWHTAYNLQPAEF